MSKKFIFLSLLGLGLISSESFGGRDCQDRYLDCMDSDVYNCEQQNPPPPRPPYTDWQRSIDECVRNQPHTRICLKNLGICEERRGRRPAQNQVVQNPIVPPPVVQPPAEESCESIGDKCANAVIAACWKKALKHGSDSYQEQLEEVADCYQNSAARATCKQSYDACVAGRGIRH